MRAETFRISMRLALAALALGAVHGIQVPFYLGNDDVVKVRTDADFKRVVERATRPALVEFYSPGCGHCVALKDTWARLARALSEHAVVAAVNCAESALCSRFGVRGVPSIRLFPAAEPTPGAMAARRRARVLGETLKKDDPRQRAEQKTGVEYADARDYDRIYAFAKRHFPARVASLQTHADAAPFAGPDAGPLRVLVLKRGTAAPSFAVRSLAVRFGDEARFASADADSAVAAVLLEKLGVAAPAKSGSGGDADDSRLVVLVDEAGAGSRFAGAFSYAAVRDHVSAALDARVRRERDANMGGLDAADMHDAEPAEQDEL